MYINRVYLLITGLESPIVTSSPPSGFPESSTPPDSPTAIRNSSATVTIDDQEQLEPTQDEIERERLIAKAEQVCNINGWMDG